MAVILPGAGVARYGFNVPCLSVAGTVSRARQIVNNFVDKNPWPWTMSSWRAAVLGRAN